jgi:NAD(P)-dependent dehydrogenase (short-subunit alcohol dehydrogenase family)
MEIKSPFDLRNKFILITGASSGIGRQCAVTADLMGAKLILIGRSKEKLDETASLLTNNKPITVVVDITNYEATDEALKKVLDGAIKIDGIIHSAGISTTLPLRSIKIENMLPYFETNVFAGINLTKLLTRPIYLNNSGMSIIFISSVMGVVGELGKTIYSLTKGSLIAGSKSLALELASKKIRVNCISPGVVETPMSQSAVYSNDEDAYNKIAKLHPLGLGQPDDIANACMFLLSDASRWITGTNLVVDGGYTAR